jgi:hypothetical protein
MVNLQQTRVHSVWRTPSGCDLYENINFSRPPFEPSTSTGAEAGPSCQTIDHPIEQIVNTSTTSVQVQSDLGIVLPSHVQNTLKVTPTLPLQPTMPYILQKPIEKPVHHRMQNPTMHIK